jgi:hypothetical protein
LLFLRASKRMKDGETVSGAIIVVFISFMHHSS